MHEVATVLQRIDLCDTISLEPPTSSPSTGSPRTRSSAARSRRSRPAAGIEPRWRARIEKRIPVAAGLGGGSSDAATALRLANETLPEPLPPERLHALARRLGADVPFFLAPGPQLGTGDGSTLQPLELPQDYAVLLLPPRRRGEGVDRRRLRAASTAPRGFAERRAACSRRSPRAKTRSRPRGAAAERPRLLAAGRRAHRPRGRSEPT